MPAFRPEIHHRLQCLLYSKKRYKVFYGGRGGGKSYSLADAALSKMLSERMIITVCREMDTTIRDSVHRLLIERIDYHNLRGAFDITGDMIKCVNGSILNYKHFHNNISEIKGLQSTKICWIFEAENLTKESWDVLYPTIRMPDSEIWLEFNPDNDDDFVMQRFVYGNDPDAIVVKINYTENDKCPPVLINEAEKCKRQSPEDYEHIWLGCPSSVGSRLYPMFETDVHVRPYSLEKVRDTAMFFMGQDPATVYYPFCVWMARVAKGEKEFDYIVYNEFPTVGMMHGRMFHEYRNTDICNLTLKQRANMYRIFDNTIHIMHNWISIEARGLDTRFAKASGAASTTLGTDGLLHTMAAPGNGGMRFETPMERNIDGQRDEIRELMTYDTGLGLVFGFNEPHFYVMPHCYNVIDAFKHHRVDKKKKCEDPTRKDPIDAIRICLATMAEHSHILKEKMQTEITPVVDAAKMLRETWLCNV